MDLHSTIANQSDQQIGGTSTDAKQGSLPKGFKTGKWEQSEIDYLREKWVSMGPHARRIQNTVSQYLNRSIDDCKAEYRKLTGGKTAKKKIEAKKEIVAQRPTEVYGAEQEIVNIFKRLHPGIKVLLAYLPEMGDAIEINLDKKKGSLMIQFDRDITSPIVNAQ
jgi:hypothetical protein